VTLSTAATALAAGVAAAHAPRGQHGIPSVTVSDARFEVLSPTLVRTEYAGDGAFTDDATFNAIGRDGFTPTPYTSPPPTAG
jgi:hypothetical protein